MYQKHFGHETQVTNKYIKCSQSAPLRSMRMLLLKKSRHFMPSLKDLQKGVRETMEIKETQLR